MSDRELRRRLREWDPATATRPPTDELRARIRSRAAGAPAPAWRRRASRRSAGRWVLAAAAAAATVLVAVTLVRPERRDAVSAESAAVQAIANGDRTVQVVYTARNGVRVYWSVPAVPSSRM